ncbi:MAG: HNH endonuclease signature motif containing protein [Acidobacteriaceae bacterium]|jgi:5-methylcytosine-specific restriction protein A
MKIAQQIVYRRLTTADFFNIYKLKGAEAHGGGQSYIDFPTSAVKPVHWARFFAGVKETTTHSGPLWKFTVNSLGLTKSQTAEIGQRRPASYNIRAQKLGTAESNRLFAWNPLYTNFPKPKDPSKRTGVPNLVIYLIRSTAGEYWAGWFQAAKPEADWEVDGRLGKMFTTENGNIELNPGVLFDEKATGWPFRVVGAALPATPMPAIGKSPPGASKALPLSPTVKPATKPPSPQNATGNKKKPHYKTRTDAEITAALFQDDFADEVPPTKKQITVEVLQRDQKIVSALKDLYGGLCQLTGDKYVFQKTNGGIYCEAHHLVALGKGGADSPYNLIIVSPLIHRMFHYADVSAIDLAHIVDNKLAITINGEPFIITWHPLHAAMVPPVSQKT